MVVSAGELGRLYLHYGNAALMGTLPAEDDANMKVINSISFSRGSKLLAAGCEDGLIHVWDLKKQVRLPFVYDVVITLVILLNYSQYYYKCY